MEFNELKTKPEKELHKMLIETRAKLREMRFKVASNQLKNVKEIKLSRKLIAQILMLLKAKKPSTGQIK